jgi:hypothetical protein
VTAHARRDDVPNGVAAALRREPRAREQGVEVTTPAGVPVAAVHCVAHRVGSL